jgi:hypothetical protein
MFNPLPLEPRPLKKKQSYEPKVKTKKISQWTIREEAAEKKRQKVLFNTVEVIS